MREDMDSPDFSVEEEVDKLLDILEKACERFGAKRSVSPKTRVNKTDSKPTKKGGGNGVRK